MTFSGSCRQLIQKNSPERASSNERYFLPGLNFTPYSTISNFWIVLGSFKRTTLSSNVFGQANVPPVVGFLSLFSMSRLMREVLMFHLLLRSSQLIILIQMQTFLLILGVIVVVCGQKEDFLKPWIANSSIQSAPVVPRAIFVSSWNPQGRKTALQHAHLFETVIICLYDLHFEAKQFRLEKLTEIQPSFVKDMMVANPGIQIILRIYVVGSARALFEYVSSSTKKIAEVAAGIVRAMRREKASGVYLDSPFNLPLKDSASGPYDKFASLLNSYIANKVKDLLWDSETLLYGLRLGTKEDAVSRVDFSSLRNLKVNGFIMEALERQADLSLMNALQFVREMRGSEEGAKMDFYVGVGLGSWRNGVGMKTGALKESLEKNGMIFRGFRHGLCIYSQRTGGAQCSVPCEFYLQVVRRYAHEMRVKLAYFQAGDAVEAQFQMI